MRTFNLLLLGLFVASQLCAANARKPKCRNLPDDFTAADRLHPARYYICKNGRVQTMRCASGQYFDETAKACRSFVARIEDVTEAPCVPVTKPCPTTTCQPTTTPPPSPCEPENTTRPCEPETTTPPPNAETTTPPCEPEGSKPQTTTPPCEPETTTPPCEPEDSKPQTTTPPCEPETTTPPCEPEDSKPETTTPPCKPPPPC